MYKGMKNLVLLDNFINKLFDVKLHNLLVYHILMVE